MNVVDVGVLLQKLRFEKYVFVFEKQWIDGVILSELIVDIFYMDCGMIKLEVVRLMIYVEKGYIFGQNICFMM